RRGEAMGVQGFFGSIGTASGPVLGSLLADRFSMNTMFFVSSLFALASVIVILGMKETLQKREPLNLSVFRISRSDLLEPAVFPAAVVVLLNTFAYGVILTVIPDLSRHLGITNKGLFFAIFTVTSLMIRILGGKASDKFGRIPVLVLSAVLISAALLLTAFADSRLLFYLAAGIYGLGLGINTPTAFAWTIDLVDENTRGKGLATSFIAMEAGIGIGALAGGYIFSNNPEHFFITFLSAAIISFLSLFYLAWYSAGHKRKARISHSPAVQEIDDVF
ncbi:MAG TPA: MFS transporter, partial [Cyclobacteriaceae bacterium]|nr:MFS transporter [Cyclobacteriaceae bacterium]